MVSNVQEEEEEPRERKQNNSERENQTWCVKEQLRGCQSWV